MSKRSSAVFAILGLATIVAASAIGQQGRCEEVNAEGVVVAVQVNPGTVRSPEDVSLESMGDFAEVWMVRVDHWIRPNGAKYILLEYTHVNRHEPFVKGRELDSTIWKFKLIPVADNQRGSCVSWGERFVPTAFGRHETLPAPKPLPCFQMQERPVLVSR